MPLFPFLAITALGGSLTDGVGARLSCSAATDLFALTLGFDGLVEPLAGFSPRGFAACCLLSGLFGAIANPAIDTFIPEATPRPATENALIAATAHVVAKLSGNLGTLILAALSAAGGFFANGVLIGLGVLCLRAHTRGPRADPAPWQPPSLRRLAAHFRAHPESFAIFPGSVMLGALVIPAFLAILFLLGGNSIGKAMLYGHYLADAPARDRAFLIGIDQTAIWGLATVGTMLLGRLVERLGLWNTVLPDTGAVLAFVALLLLRGRLWALRGR